MFPVEGSNFQDELLVVTYGMEVTKWQRNMSPRNTGSSL